jgi:hypothetical protein
MPTIAIVNRETKTIETFYQAAAPAQHQYGGHWGWAHATVHLVVPEDIDKTTLMVNVDSNGEYTFVQDPDKIMKKQQAQWAALRTQRNIKLSETDWTQIADAPISNATKIAYLDYRQALRDIIKNTVDPLNPVWPTPPGKQTLSPEVSPVAIPLEPTGILPVETIVDTSTETTVTPAVDTTVTPTETVVESTTVTPAVDTTVDSTTVTPAVDTTVTPTETVVTPAVDTTVDSTTVTPAVDTTVDSTTVTPSVDTTVTPSVDTTVTPSVDTTVDSTTVTPAVDTTVTPAVDTTATPTETTATPTETTVTPSVDTTMDSTTVTPSVDTTVEAPAAAAEAPVL